MAQGIDVIAVVGQIAVDAVKIRVAHFQAGRRNDRGVNVMAIGLGQHRTADRAELGIGAGGGGAGGVAGGRDRLALRIAAGFAGVFHHAVVVADGGGQHCAVVHAVSGGGNIVVDEAVPADGADVQHISPGGAGGRGDIDNEVVSGRLRDVLNVPVPADAALPDGVAGGGAGRGHIVGPVAVVALGGDRFLHVAAIHADVQRLAVYLAGGVTDHDGLIGMADGVDVIALFDQSAVDADITVISDLAASGKHSFHQRPVVRIAAGVVMAVTAVAVRVLAIAVRIAAAAAAGATVVVLVPEPNVGNAVLGHLRTLIAVGDLVVHGVLSFLRVVGRGCQGAVLGGVAVADGGGNASFGQVGNRQGMGLAVHDAVVVGDHALGGDKLILRVLAQFTVPDDGETLVSELGDDVGVQVVALQTAFVGVPCAVAERAVVTAVNRDHVVGVVHILVAHFFIQRLNEVGVTVIEPVDVFARAVILDTAVGVHRAAGVAAGFCPVIAGVGGVHAGNTVQNGSGAYAVQHRAVRILDVPAQSGLPVACVFRGAPDGERRGLVTDEAVE